MVCDMTTRWLPVPESLTTLLSAPKGAVDIADARPVIDAILKGSTPNLPKKLADFPALRSNGQWLSRKIAAELGFAVGTGHTSYSLNTYVQQLAAWVDVPDATGTTQVRYGITVRYIVTAEAIKAGAKVNSIGGIAASASFETLRASAEFSTIGIPASWLIDQVPTGGAFDLNKYVEFEGASRGALKVLKAKENDVLKPQILEVRGTVNDAGSMDYEDALAVSWALSCIARRLKLGSALGDYEKASDTFRASVETMYARIAGVSSVDETPSKAAGHAAQQLLNGLKVEED